MLKLIIEDDEGRKTVVPFVRDEITIGRQEGNTIRLTERNVSRRHARLMRQNGHVLVEDLGSYNGIKINGDRIAGQVKVNDGDLIQIGDYDLAVQHETQEQYNASNASTQELIAVPPRPPAASAAAQERAARAAAEQRAQADTQATMPALPLVAPPAAQTADDDAAMSETALDETGLDETEPDEADPDDISSAPTPLGADDHSRRQSTAVIRMDQVEASRPRQVVEIDATEAPRLVVLTTNYAGKEFSCVRSELRIGRTEDNDISLDHASLSRTHCKVVREDTGEWRVIDMHSANGLKVNGETYAQSPLKHGDTIELGHVKLKFVGAGQSYTFKPGAADRTGGGKAPAIFIALVLLAGAAAAAYYLFIKPTHDPAETVSQADPKQPPPPPENTDAPEPAEVSADQQRADAAKKVAEARLKIDTLQWEEARKLLSSCFIGESPCPEATGLLADLKNEEPLKAAIEQAAKLLDEGKLAEAKASLDSAERTRLLQVKLQELKLKLSKATAKPPVEAAVAVAAATKPDVKRLLAEASDLYKEAKGKEGPAQKAKLTAAKAKLKECLKIDEEFADCHKLLGATFAKLGDGEQGLKHYERFVELAPDNPSAPQVRTIIEQFKATRP